MAQHPKTKRRTNPLPRAARLHDERLKGSLTMQQLDSIKQDKLSQNERDILAADAERWKRLGSGGHLDDWLAFYPGLRLRRNLGMEIAHTNKPEGRNYVFAFRQLMAADGMDSGDKVWSHVLWLGDKPEHMIILREVLESMTPGQRSRLNSPIAARQRVEQVLKAREGGAEEKLKTSPLAVMKKALVERDKMIEHLKEQLAASEQGSLFDLKKDNADSIASVIVGNVGATKAASISKQITEKLKKRATPAG
jgi:hypothetical protein